MSDKKSVNINYGAPMAEFMSQVMRVVASQDDCIGAGAHGPEDHHGHGLHGQVSIGLAPKTTVYFRESLD